MLPLITQETSHLAFSLGVIAQNTIPFPIPTHTCMEFAVELSLGVGCQSLQFNV